MNNVENSRLHEAQTTVGKIFDLLIGFLGSLIIGNIAIVLIATVDTPERLWISYFTWFWRFALAGLAVFLYTRKRIWISIGIVAAILLQLL